MSHKEKICNTALTSHIEVCHEQHSYTPLVVNRTKWQRLPSVNGLKSVIKSSLEEESTPVIDQLKSTYLKKVQSLKNALARVYDKGSVNDTGEKLDFSTQELKEPTFALVDEELKRQLNHSIEQAQEAIVKKSKGFLDTSNPERAIELREEKYRDLVNKYDDKDIELEPMPYNKAYELEGLGIFFKESVCYRPEGFTYSPCGKEMTILPGEEIKESNILTTVVKEEDSNEQTISQEFTTEDSEKDVTTFTESYENTIKKETDIKLAREASFKVKLPFKIFSLDLSGSSSGSFNFNKLVETVNKFSHKNTRTRFHEVIHKINTNSTSSSSRSFTSTDKYTHIRNWKNDTDMPQTYVKRKSYCKTSVIHKRHDVHLAWNGCIDNPAKDLCTPDNLEIKHADDIQAIKDKWSSAAAPAEFGTRPSNQKRCTGHHYYSSNIGAKKPVPVNDTIPAGWYYVGGAQLEIVNSTTTPQTSYVDTQPSFGAVGGITFGTYVDVENRGFHKERATVKVCYIIAPDAAKDWDAKVDAWRDEQAQKEIDAFLEEETKKLNQFLASDQARAAVERRIMEDFFGVTPIQDCCKLIARLRKLFDFDNMGYSLLPAWNELGEGCQRSFPVNLYTAKCLHFYLPINAGMERKALTLLASINAIPWSPQLAPQILAYIQQIQNMRATLYNRLFDPTRWDVKFDQPKGYDMTKYDTSNPDWEADHESNLNFEVLGAFTVNIPCGERIDKRPLLCDS